MTDVPAGILAGCDRLVHPTVVGRDDRDRQRRFIAVMLAAPFVAGMVPLLAPFPGFGLSALLALLCGVITVSWAFALSVSLSAASANAERLALGLAIIAVPMAAIAAGSSSPLLLLVAAIGFETWWVGRSARAALAGAAAVLASLAVYSLLAGWFAPTSGTAHAWQWLPPALYAALAWPRVSSLLRGAPASAGENEREAVESAFDLPVLRLAPSGEIAGASDAVARKLGVAQDILIGSTLVERIHLADRIAFMGALAEIRRTGAAQDAVEARLRVVDADGFGGGYRPFSLQFAPDGGDLAVLLRDISEMAELRSKLERARDTAESTELTKSRFLAAVSHELRTPLNSIIGFSDMLMHGIAGEFNDGRQRDYVGLIRQSGTHLLSVVNAILDVSKIESGAYSIRPEPFAVKEAIDLCHSMVAQQAREKGLTLTARVLPDPGEISADRRAVQQIVLNLLTNAIKFTPSGGSVCVDVARSGPWLRLVVSDTGIGIAEADLDRIGKPFMQVRNDFTRQFDGAGLGLSLVKGLVGLHEGEMSIESAPGEGTAVTVSLPVAGPKHVEGDADAWNQPAALHRIGGSDETVRKTA